MFGKKEAESVNILEFLRQQIAAQVQEAVGRRTVAKERLNLLVGRAETLGVAKKQKEEENTKLKGGLENTDDPGDPVELNRRICANDEEITGLEERIKSFSKGGAAFLAAKKEYDEAGKAVRMAVHDAINQIRPQFEEGMNSLLEEANRVNEDWEAAAAAIRSELGAQSLNEFRGADQLRVDKKRSNFSYFGQYQR